MLLQNHCPLPFRLVESNLVAIRPMWRQIILIWQQAHFFMFHILGNYKDCKPYVQSRVEFEIIILLTLLQIAILVKIDKKDSLGKLATLHIRLLWQQRSSCRHFCYECFLTLDNAALDHVIIYG
jgi:hypothetical protein